jgi:hypothetical protein
LEPTPLDQKFWERRDVDILDMSLDRYIAALRARTLMLPGAVEVAHAREPVHRVDAVL